MKPYVAPSGQIARAGSDIAQHCMVIGSRLAGTVQRGGLFVSTPKFITDRSSELKTYARDYTRRRCICPLLSARNLDDGIAWAHARSFPRLFAG